MESSSCTPLNTLPLTYYTPPQKEILSHLTQFSEHYHCTKTLKESLTQLTSSVARSLLLMSRSEIPQIILGICDHFLQYSPLCNLKHLGFLFKQFSPDSSSEESFETFLKNKLSSAPKLLEQYWQLPSTVRSYFFQHLSFYLRPDTPHRIWHITSCTRREYVSENELPAAAANDQSRLEFSLSKNLHLDLLVKRYSTSDPSYPWKNHFFKCNHEDSQITCEGFSFPPHTNGKISEYKIVEKPLSSTCSLIEEKISIQSPNGELKTTTSRYAVNPENQPPVLFSQFINQTAYHHWLKGTLSSEETKKRDPLTVTLTFPLVFPELPSSCDEIKENSQGFWSSLFG